MPRGVRSVSAQPVSVRVASSAISSSLGGLTPRRWANCEECSGYCSSTSWSRDMRRLEAAMRFEVRLLGGLKPLGIGLLRKELTGEMRRPLRSSPPALMGQTWLNILGKSERHGASLSAESSMGQKGILASGEDLDTTFGGDLGSTDLMTLVSSRGMGSPMSSATGIAEAAADGCSSGVVNMSSVRPGTISTTVLRISGLCCNSLLVPMISLQEV